MSPAHDGSNCCRRENRCRAEAGVRMLPGLGPRRIQDAAFAGKIADQARAGPAHRKKENHGKPERAPDGLDQGNRDSRKAECLDGVETRLPPSLSPLRRRKTVPSFLEGG